MAKVVYFAKDVDNKHPGGAPTFSGHFTACGGELVQCIVQNVFFAAQAGKVEEGLEIS